MLVFVFGMFFMVVVKYVFGVDIYQIEIWMLVEIVVFGVMVISFSYLFVGVKVWEIINGYQQNLGIDCFVDLIDWGWFYFLIKLIFCLLYWLYGFIGNMGWLIIVLIFILKILVFLLVCKFYILMVKMKELQFEMEVIKECVGDDWMKY